MNNMFDWSEHKKIIDKFILPQKKKITYLIIIILLGIIASMAIPYVFGKIIDLIVIKDLQLVLKFILISLFLNIFQSLSSILEEWIGNILSIDCSNSIKEAMFAKILNTRYEFLNSYGEGELVSRIENTGDKIVSFYIDLFSSIVMIMFSIIISAYIMISISLKLFIIAIILLPLTYGINYIFKNAIISKQRDYIAKLDAYSDYLIDTISNLTGIKLNNLEKTFKGNYKNKLQDLKNVSMSNMKINITVTSLHDLITIILSSLILFISAKLIILGNLTLGNIVAFSSYMEKLHSSIKKIGDLNLSFNEVIVDLERYKKIMDYDSENEIDGKKLSKVTSLKFKNVSFKYDDKYILKDFSFEISKPGLYAIVGENGSGKTTIFNLISKLYTNYEGEILINGNEISDYKDEDLRNEVLFVESKPFILRDNLTSNITLLEKNKVDELYLEKIIKNLDLRNVENHNGSNIKDTLSKGEQQKVQLARLLLKEYPLILLDECFSAFDEVTKKTVISELKKRSKNSIIIIISHDQEIIKRCDKTLFILDKKNYG
ncbi:ABC transporter transmembrane domain-containing protein [Streptococcus agalactiae]|uniref:ABC transporter transmembrane domain-containing protein n=1 Tax=Streptococcus agalactiae TaxID=1311 RepID=UPI00067E1108|nr:ABC transporter ATP-binding protein [Streptococcus agalactiae]